MPFKVTAMIDAMLADGYRGIIIKPDFWDEPGCREVYTTARVVNGTLVDFGRPHYHHRMIDWDRLERVKDIGAIVTKTDNLSIDEYYRQHLEGDSVHFD